METKRDPIVTSLDPLDFALGVVTGGPSSTNVLWSSYADQRSYATQRPAVEVIGLSAANGFPAKGRGIVYWDKVAGEASNGIYFVNDNIVYAGSYSNPITNNTITAGRDPVHFVEAGNFLVLLDAENNQGWYIDGAAPEQMFRITAGAFPGIQNGAQLAGGGAELDGFLYVLDTDGVIYNSHINDVTQWRALDFLEAQREQDAGVYLTKHHDNIVALGSNSTEFFYNAGNPTGSPLQRRPDISYRTGALGRKTVFTSGERIYFLGSEKIGTPSLYEISGYQLAKVSTDSIDRFIAHTRTTESYELNMTGGFIGEHYMTFLNTLRPNTDGTYTPVFTMYYDAGTQLWGTLDTDISTIDAFGIAGVSERSAILQGESTLLFMSGDLAVFNNDGSTLDTSGEDQYVDDDYTENQLTWVTGGIAELTSNIPINITFNENDFGSLTNKFMYRLGVVGTSVGKVTDVAPILISWTDDTYKTFSNTRFYATDHRRIITMLGTFKRRAFKLEYNGTERLRLENLEYTLDGSEFA